MSLAVSAYEKVADPIAAAATLGEWLAKSGMFGCERVEQGNILALQCMVERKAPLELAKHYHIIGGKLSLRSDAMLALYRERGGKVQWQQFDAQAARARWVYDGNDVVLEYSAADAKAAGLMPGRPGSGWAKFPAEMLRARLISKAVRMLAPEVCTGQYTPEELADMQTPTQRASAPQVFQPAATAAPTPAPVDVDVIEPQYPQTLDGVIEASGIDRALCVSFLTAREWIKDGDVSTLAPVRLKKILEKPDQFIAAVISASSGGQA